MLIHKINIFKEFNFTRYMYDEHLDLTPATVESLFLGLFSKFPGFSQTLFELEREMSSDLYLFSTSVLHRPTGGATAATTLSMCITYSTTHPLSHSVHVGLEKSNLFYLIHIIV